MRAHSLRLRLLLASAISVILALTVAGIALSALFSDHVQRGIRANLEAELSRLTALVDVDAPELTLTQPMSDPRFVIPYGGVYWQITDPGTGERARSRSMWDQALAPAAPLPGDGSIAVTTVPTPDGETATALARRLSFDRADGTSRVLELIVAEDNAALNAANAAYRIDLARALVVLAVILVLAAWAQVTLGLSPLSVIHRGITAIRTGKSSTLEGDFPSEVMPLVIEVNELIRTNEVSIDFARARAADLAHGLKTSLTILNAEAHEIRQRGNAASADAIEQLAAGMAETIDHQLRLSRLRHRTPSGYHATPLAGAIGRVVATLQKTPKGGTLDWQVDTPRALGVSLDGPDLTELLGVILENAAKWAKANVRIKATGSDGTAVISIDDDGPGLDDAKLKSIGQRGKRLDETLSGTGIGLSIAREIVALNGGTLAFARSALGGLCVTIRLPVAIKRSGPA